MEISLESCELYTIAWIAALPIERAAATALLDEIHDEPDGFIQHKIDKNSYTWGRSGKHNVVIASLEAGVDGTISAATTALELISSLPHIRFGLLVGIGGGIAKPDKEQDIRLGDVVVSEPVGTTGGVVQYDYGKAKADGVWEQKGSLNAPPEKEKDEFQVDEQRVHLGLFRNSLRVMDASLKEDICNLVWPGTECSEITSAQVAFCVPDELQYACRHWVYHYQKIESPLLNLEEVFTFLQKHLFHWLEVLSLVKSFRESFHAIRQLQTIFKSERNKANGQLLREIHSFLQMNSTIIDHYPLQLYSSLMFSIPAGTRLGQMLPRRSPSWMRHVPEPVQISQQAQYILEGHERPVSSDLHFALDNSRLVSRSSDGQETRIWDLDTGDCIRVITDDNRTYKGPSKLSYDGLWLAATSRKDQTGWGRVFWESDHKGSDTDSQGDESDICSEEENSNASCDEEEAHPSAYLNLWWLESGVVICTPGIQGIAFVPTQFSPDHTIFACMYGDACVRTWRVETGECLTALHGYELGLSPWSMSVSPDFKLICSTAETQTISVWANDAIETDRSLRDQPRSIESVVLSSDRTLAATSFDSGIVRIWNMGTNEHIHQFQHGSLGQITLMRTHPELLQFSEDSKHLFAWRPRSFGHNERDDVPYLVGHLVVWDLIRVSIAPDNRFIVSVLDFTGAVYDVKFSLDSQSVLVLSSDTYLQSEHERGKWLLSKFNIAQADHIVSIRSPTRTQRVLVVSSDARFLVLQTSDGQAHAILTGTGELLYKFRLEGDEHHVSLVENDSTLLECQARFLTLRNSSNGQIIRQLPIDFGSFPRRLSFDTNTQQIHTNFGTIAIHGPSADNYPDELSLNNNLTGFGISCDGSWLLWNNKKVFWLRPAYRPWNESMEVSGSTVVIGTVTGHVLFFQFDEPNYLTREDDDRF
ncbi:vegetative incompatibility het-E-1 [Fusarium subglutinans]|uniref:Vegetative incompatibility het-E-1 n=1 Tax=Gibberella subglutinans TaxID=42677 RepID=A0A8H5QAD6_GIBSU|nr:vegetative incompatibility het-E-1 [Fusarium subglutinans]KAF5611637.1 vegetative incompatibility het-E-1 [Fusarium subglutinans]